MPTRTIRQEARSQVFEEFTAQLNRMIQENKGVPLQGATRADFEDRTGASAQTALPVVLEERAALAINEDRGTPLDGKKIQRRSEAIEQGGRVRRDTEVCACKQKHRPTTPANALALPVIGMDCGRVQTSEKQRNYESHWRRGTAEISNLKSEI